MLISRHDPRGSRDRSVITLRSIFAHFLEPSENQRLNAYYPSEIIVDRNLDGPRRYEDRFYRSSIATRIVHVDSRRLNAEEKKKV